MRIILTSLVIAALIACLPFLCIKMVSRDYGDNYKYKWKVAVTYTNGDQDTLDCEYDSFKGNECFLYLSHSEGGPLSGGSSGNCIITGCGFHKRLIVCGVRKYEVLTLDRIPIKNTSRR